MITLQLGSARALVDERLGARLSALTVNDIDILVAPFPCSAAEPLLWGCYPMAPFAGRVKDGRFSFAGLTVDVPRRDGAHALHGTVDLAEWTVLAASVGEAHLKVDLGPDWPYKGTVEQRIQLSPDEIRLELLLEAHEAMPAQVGWHPWFVRPASIRGDFPAWLPRGSDSMPCAEPVADVPQLEGEIDDCFVAGEAPVRLELPGLSLELSSDCSHWVVYTEADHGVCVEPQSGPPNEINTAPRVLQPGEHLRRWFQIRWQTLM